MPGSPDVSMADWRSKLVLDPGLGLLRVLHLVLDPLEKADQDCRPTASVGVRPHVTLSS